MHADIQEPSKEQKLSIIHSNKHLIPDIFVNDIPRSLSSSLHNLSSEQIKLETFYQLTQPLLHSFGPNFSLDQFLDPGHNEVLYPVCAVVVFQHEYQNEKFYAASLRVISWIESGGLRCVPLKIDASQQQIDKILINSHCLIIPDFSFKIRAGKQLNTEIIFENISKITEIAHRMNEPVLTLGYSCISMLSKIKGSKIQFRYLLENSSLSEFYLSHSSFILRNIELQTRLHIENRKKIKLPTVQIDSHQVYGSPEISLSAIATDKNKNSLAVLIQDKNRQFYFLLNSPEQQQTPESISLWHKLIVNFVNEAKKKKKQVKQKTIEKILIAHHKLVNQQDHQVFYKVF